MNIESHEIEEEKGLQEMAACQHKYGDRFPTPYKNEYVEMCVECGHVNTFEKDYS